MEKDREETRTSFTKHTPRDFMYEVKKVNKLPFCKDQGLMFEGKIITWTKLSP